MVKYECFRCGYTNKIKSNFIKHLNRKFICQPILNNISTEEIYKKYFEKSDKKGLAKLGAIRQKSEKVRQKLGKIRQKKNNVYLDHKCKYCGKFFKHKSSKCTHERKRCKKNKELLDYRNSRNNKSSSIKLIRR